MLLALATGTAGAVVAVACGSSSPGAGAAPDGSMPLDAGADVTHGGFDCAAYAQTAASLFEQLGACVEGGLGASPQCVQALLDDNCAYLSYQNGLYGSAWSNLESTCFVPLLEAGTCAFLSDVDAQAAAQACELRVLASTPPTAADTHLKNAFCAFCPDTDAGAWCTDFYGANGGVGTVYLALSDSIVSQLAQSCAPPAGWDAASEMCAASFTACAQNLLRYLVTDAAPPLVQPASCPE